MVTIQELPLPIEQQLVDLFVKAGEFARSGNIASSIDYSLKARDLIPQLRRNLDDVSANDSNQYVARIC